MPSPALSPDRASDAFKRDPGGCVQLADEFFRGRFEERKQGLVRRDDRAVDASHRATAPSHFRRREPHIADRAGQLFE